MRLRLWFILVLAFSVGMGCAFAFRFFYFDAAPVARQTVEPKTKILVAKRMIPSGVEITADLVIFQEVCLSEVPIGTLSTFAGVYRRQPAYPIPAGCPICEDLLLPPVELQSQTAFVPTGSQLVTLDVTRIRQGGKFASPKDSLSALLGSEQRVDIRIVPSEAQGRLAEKKNAVLQMFAPQDFKNSGELLLENVPIHQIQRQLVADSVGMSRDSLMLMLDTNDAMKLSAAAKRGQIRVLVRPEAKTDSQPAEIRNAVEVANQKQPLLSPPLLEQPLLADIPFASEHTPPTQVEPVPVIAMEQVQQNAPEPEPADIFNWVIPSVPVVTTLPTVRENKSEDDAEASPNLRRLDQRLNNLSVSVPPESALNEEVVAIRNDPMVVFGTLPLRSAPVEGSASVTKPERETPDHASSEPSLSVPRINTVQFLPPGSLPSAKVVLQETKSRTESPRIPPAVSSATPPPASIMVPLPAAMQDRMPGYSPFERRIYTVPSSDDSGAVPGEELPVPQRLPKSSDAGS